MSNALLSHTNVKTHATSPFTQVKNHSKKLLSTLVLLGMGLAFNAQANTLVYCAEASPEGFNPQLFASGTTHDASAWPLYNRLVDFAPASTEIVPSLAESWTVSEDGKVYTFNLRKDVKFHTTDRFTPSRNFNADDVIFSFMRQKDTNHPFHAVSGGNYEYFQGMGLPELISSIEKVDDHTLKITLTRPEAPFLANIAMGFASILSAEYADQMLAANTPEVVDLEPVGTGPFQLAEYQKDSTIIYDTFADYWGSVPKIDSLIFSITPDASIRYAKLQKDECQIMAFPNPSEISMMKENSAINVLEKPGLNVGYVGFNTNKPPLDNVKVRQALRYAVNKPAILEAVYQGTGQSAKTVLPPNMWGFNDQVADSEFDLEKAKALLAEAGVTEGLKIDLWAMPVQRPYNPNARRMAEMIQADWKKIGVEANIVTFEWGEYIKRAKDGEHQVVTLGWGSDNGDPDNFMATLFSCDAAKDGSNYSRWCYEPYDELVTKAKTALNHEERVELYKQAQVILDEQVPAIMMAHSTEFEPVSKRVSNYQMDGIGRHKFDTVVLAEKE